MGPGGPGHERRPVTGWGSNLAGIGLVVAAATVLSFAGMMLALIVAVLSG